MEKIKSIWFENERIYARFYGGKEAWQSLLWYPRLRNATDKERDNYRFIAGEGIHWEDVDEDISFESFFMTIPSRVKQLGCLRSILKSMYLHLHVWLAFLKALWLVILAEQKKCRRHRNVKS